MEIILNKQLKKEFLSFTQSLKLKQSHNSEEILEYITHMESKFQESFKTVTADMDRKLSDSKHQIKHKNKALNQLKEKSDAQRTTWKKQKEELQRQNQKNKRKVHELLKLLEKNTLAPNISATKPLSDQGSQCMLQDQKFQKLLEQNQKQNICLAQKINQLQWILKDKNQDIDAANILIENLIKQLETNFSDRETARGMSSPSESDADCDSQLRDQPGELCFSENQYQVSADSSNCGVGDNTQDLSTIAGSVSTNKDYALPQWLQFDEVPIYQSKEMQVNDQEFQMWPELIWNRCRQLFGLSYEI